MRCPKAFAVAPALGLLSACAHYLPAPPHPERFAPAFDARRLDERPDGAVWSAADLLSAALRHNPTVVQAAAKYRVAVAAARAARIPPAATLTLTAEYAEEHQHWGHAAAPEIPLDLGARRTVRITTADLQALQALYDYEEAAWAVRTALMKARDELLSADEEIRLADRAAALRRERLERLERRVAAGEDDQLLALNAQNDRIAADRRAEEARARRVQGAVALAKALGVAPGAVADIRLAPPPSPPHSPDVSALRRDAALSRKDVLRAIADYDLAENALRLEIAKQYPEVKVGPGYYWDHGVLKLPFNLALALPPADLNRANIRHAEAARAAAGRALEAVQADALDAVDRSAAALDAAHAALARARDEQLPAARRQSEAAARLVSAGEGDRPDELAARAAEVEAELAVLDAQRTYLVATADLEDALRRPFDPAEATVLQAQVQPEGAER